jgi:tetratricopeptide (TPR) repeat protein
MSVIKTLFETGNYKKIQEIFLSREKIADSDIVYFIAGLGFAGDIDNALAIYKNYFSREKALVEEKIKANFYLAIGLTRVSKYEDARKIFGQNFYLKSKLSRSSPSHFYIYQGLSFFRYFQGFLHKALNLAQKASTYAEDSEEVFLVTDLLAHIFTQIGEWEKGKMYFEKAISLAREKKREGFKEAANISFCCYLHELGINSVETREQIEVLLKQENQSFYAKTTLMLEKIRGYIQQGELKKAHQLLEQASFIIYRTDNRRHGILLNHQLAYIHYLRGDYLQALNAIDLSKKLCHPLMDKIHKLKVLGLERKILLKLLKEDQSLKGHIDTIKEQMMSLTHATGRALSYRYLKREGLSTQDSIHILALDHYGDHLDSLKNDGVITKEILQYIFLTSNFGLLRHFFKDKEASSRPQISTNIKAKTLVWFNRGEVNVYQTGITGLIIQALQLLSNEKCSKEDLIQKLYNYQYSPLIHDPMLYTLLSRIRKILGDNSSYLKQEDGVYYFDAEFIDEKASKTRPKVLLGNFDKLAQLNPRQFELIRSLNEKPTMVTPKSYKELHQISRITATRDLVELCDFGFLQQFGKARATAYTLALVSPHQESYNE